MCINLHAAQLVLCKKKKKKKKKKKNNLQIPSAEESYILFLTWVRYGPSTLMWAILKIVTNIWVKDTKFFLKSESIFWIKYSPEANPVI